MHKSTCKRTTRRFFVQHDIRLSKIPLKNTEQPAHDLPLILQKHSFYEVRTTLLLPTTLPLQADAKGMQPRIVGFLREAGLDTKTALARHDARYQRRVQTAAEKDAIGHVRHQMSLNRVYESLTKRLQRQSVFRGFRERRKVLRGREPTGGGEERGELAGPRVEYVPVVEEE